MITPLTADKRKALELVTAQIDKQFGTGAIMRFGAAMPGRAIETIPTGSIALDLALGVGGIPRGRIIEVYGPESSGKTTLCQHILAEAQKLGGTVAYIDVEHALDLQYARTCGLTIEEMLISQPDTGEQALQIVDLLVRSGGLDAIVPAPASGCERAARARDSRRGRHRPGRSGHR